ncbi:MAG: hypothetical protein PVSMB1_07360 [Gemmatimonadaceae bacterium]
MRADHDWSQVRSIVVDRLGAVSSLTTTRNSSDAPHLIDNETASGNDPVTGGIGTDAVDWDGRSDASPGHWFRYLENEKRGERLSTLPSLWLFSRQSDQVQTITPVELSQVFADCE